MIAVLWENRTRPPILSRGWFKTWGKRLLLSRHLWTQWRYHVRLRGRGAVVATSAFFSDVRQICGGAVSSLRVGEESFVGRVDIAAHAAVEIGQRVCINDGVRILTASHDVSDPQWRSFAKPVKIKDYAWVATGAILLPGVTIGVGAVVGAGAVVGRDVEDYSIVTGNPATPHQKSRTRGLLYSPVRSLALYEAWLGRPSTEENKICNKQHSDGL